MDTRNNRISQRVQLLRGVMEKKGFHAVIITSMDPHLGEYTPERWHSRTWISGFTGSAGTVVVTPQKAGLWTDSRYFLQASQELKGSGIDLYKEGVPGTLSIEEFLQQEVQASGIVAVDGECFTAEQARSMQGALENYGIRLETSYDLIEEIWQDRPIAPRGELFVHPEEFAGESTKERIRRIVEQLHKKGANATLMVMLDELCWALNLRGSDVDYNPVGLGFGYISDDRSAFFSYAEKITPEVRTSLTEAGVEVYEYNQFYSFLSSLEGGKRVWVDPNRISARAASALPQSCKIIEAPSVITLMKSYKNAAEIEGVRRAMLRDGVALTKFFMWLEKRLQEKEPINEYEVGEELTRFRAQQERYVSDSFATICGYKDHGAIVHYRATPQGAHVIEPKGMLLLDSGGQYLDGTTDITRTISLGNPSAQQKTDYTLVLKGHIAIATAQFPEGTRGNQLDILARKALWDKGLSYGHGTGHGVGVFMNVHEGPQNIRTDNNPTPMALNTLTSNEPGLYRSGEYGIRIENLILTIPKETTEFGAFYGFETLTLCYLDNDLVDVTLLTSNELDWYNAYQESVYQKLSSLLSQEEKEWLRAKTAPLSL